MSKSLEEVENSGKALKMFVCGPTVYDFAQIGNAKTYIQMDLLARTLRRNGYKLTYIQNITDIDDKIIAKANQSNISYKEISERFEKEYLVDIKSLNINSVDKYVKATDHIDDIISQIDRLLAKGYAYKISDGIYFEVAKFLGYGKLSGRVETRKDDAQSRIDESKSKKGWNDFCLWKFSRQNEPSWEAPFGAGRPGWHIEDTAITESYFGPQYDIHGGAVDLIFPHHEAEITQMESISGKTPFVKYWVHAGFLTVDGKRMGKSEDNFVTIRDALKKYAGHVIRLYILQSHYRSELNFSWDNLEEAKARLKSFNNFANLRHQPLDIEKNIIDYRIHINNINEFMTDDLASPKALAYISKLIDETIYITTDEADSFVSLIEYIEQIFGLGLLEQIDVSAAQKELIAKRAEARADKNWQEADRIRNQLESQFIGLKDVEAYSIWYRF